MYIDHVCADVSLISLKPCNTYYMSRWTPSSLIEWRINASINYAISVSDNGLFGTKPISTPTDLLALCGGSLPVTHTMAFFHTKGQQRGKRFYVLMSSWRRLHQGNIVNWLIDSEWRINASVNYTMNVSDYGLSPNRHQNNIWTLICASIELFRTHFSNISIEIHKFSVRETCFKMPVQWRPFCLGLNVLRMFAC